jgi:hypothetical protein
MPDLDPTITTVVCSVTIIVDPFHKDSSWCQARSSKDPMPRQLICSCVALIAAFLLIVAMTRPCLCCYCTAFCCYRRRLCSLGAIVTAVLMLLLPPLLVCCVPLSSSHNRSSFPPQLSATSHNNSGFLLLLIWQIYTASSFSERMFDGRLLVGSCQHRCYMYITVRFTYNLVLVL